MSEPAVVYNYSAPNFTQIRVTADVRVKWYYDHREFDNAKSMVFIFPANKIWTVNDLLDQYKDDIVCKMQTFDIIQMNGLKFDIKQQDLQVTDANGASMGQSIHLREGDQIKVLFEPDFDVVYEAYQARGY